MLPYGLLDLDDLDLFIRSRLLIAL